MSADNKNKPTSGFTSQSSDGTHTISVPMVWAKELENVLAGNIKMWSLSEDTLHIFDLSGVQELPPFGVRLVLAFQKDLKKAEKNVALVNLSPALDKSLREQGLKTSFNVFLNSDEAKKKFTLSKVRSSGLDMEIIKPFIDGTVNTLNTQIGISVTAQKPFIKSKENKMPADIAGVINLNAPTFRGAVAVCFSEQVFLAVYEKMVGEKHSSLVDEVKDGASELMNIIFGQAKTVLKDKKGIPIEKAIPTVLTGKGLEVSFKADSPTIVLPFQTEIGSFHIEIIVDRKE